MKFEEENSIEIKKCNNVFVYFLLKNNIVVYVGQTKNGLLRPLSHKDKDYDTIKIIYCKENELDFLEDYYITKYNPIYNQMYNVSMNYGLKRCKIKLNEYFKNNYNGKKIGIPLIKKIINKLEIKIYSINGNSYIKTNDYEKILDFLKNKENI